MKTFLSIASRRRQYTAIVRSIGVAGCVGGLLWLVVIEFRSPKLSDFDPLPAQRAALRPSSNDELLAFANRRLRPPTPPPVVAATAPAPKQVKPPELELVATMVNPGQTPRAFVRSKLAGKLLTVQPGKVIDGATVSEIRDGQLVLEVDGNEFIIRVGRKPS
jgi:hypothetical protein